MGKRALPKFICASQTFVVGLGKKPCFIQVLEFTSYQELQKMGRHLKKEGSTLYIHMVFHVHGSMQGKWHCRAKARRLICVTAGRMERWGWLAQGTALQRQYDQSPPSLGNYRIQHFPFPRSCYSHSCLTSKHRKHFPKLKRVLWYEASWKDNSRRSFCLTKHTPTILPPLESRSQNGCKQIPHILPWEWQRVRFIFPGQRMKANRLPRRPDYQSSLWVLPEFNVNEDSCHQDGILCNNLLGKKEGFVRFRGHRAYHHFCPSLTARVSAHTHTQQNCQVRVQGREMPWETEDEKKPQRTQYSVTQKVKKAKAQLLANTMASGTLVTGASLLVATRPCKEEPGVWQLPATSARFSNWSNWQDILRGKKVEDAISMHKALRKNKRSLASLSHFWQCEVSEAWDWGQGKQGEQEK